MVDPRKRNAEVAATDQKIPTMYQFTATTPEGASAAMRFVQNVDVKKMTTIMLILRRTGHSNVS